MFKSRHTSPTPPAPSFPPPERDGDAMVITSRGQLVGWNTTIHERPHAMRELKPQIGP